MKISDTVLEVIDKMSTTANRLDAVQRVDAHLRVTYLRDDPEAVQLINCCQILIGHFGDELRESMKRVRELFNEERALE